MLFRSVVDSLCCGGDESTGPPWPAPSTIAFVAKAIASHCELIHPESAVELLRAFALQATSQGPLASCQRLVIRACLSVHGKAGDVESQSRIRHLASMVVASAIKCGRDDKRLARACRHALNVLTKTDPQVAYPAIVGELSSLRWAEGRLESISERCRVALVHHLATEQASRSLGTDDAGARALARLRPTARSPTGRIVWDDGGPHRQPISCGGDILSWNVDGLKARLQEVLRLLSTRRPAVAFFSETKRAAEKMDGLVPDAGLRSKLAELGYQYVYATSCTLETLGPGNYGVMAVSRLRPASYMIGLRSGTLDREGRSITLRFGTPGGDAATLSVVGSYSPCSKPGLVPDRRLQYDAALAGHLAEEARISDCLVFVGDHNVTPSDGDVDPGGLRPSLVASDRKSTRLNSSHSQQSRMPSSA